MNEKNFKTILSVFKEHYFDYPEYEDQFELTEENIQQFKNWINNDKLLDRASDRSKSLMLIDRYELIGNFFQALFLFTIDEIESISIDRARRHYNKKHNDNFSELEPSNLLNVSRMMSLLIDSKGNKLLTRGTLYNHAKGKNPSLIKEPSESSKLLVRRSNFLIYVSSNFPKIYDMVKKQLDESFYI